MSRKHLKYDEKLGHFVEVEKPSVEQLPEHLRELPSNYVTKDTSDPDKIHELDAPHIVTSLTMEQAAKEHNEVAKKPDDILKGIDLTNGPLTQLHIDLIRFKVIRNMVASNMKVIEEGGVAPFNLKRTRHLWFPKNQLDPRELREGRPPLRTDLPWFLKDKDLVVDAYNWPARIIDMLRAKGLDVPNIAAMEATMEQNASQMVH